MKRQLTTLLGATAFATVLAVFVTWPQARHMSTSIFSHHDPYFSIWRLAWVAHALSTSPGHLFDANIFYPATGTLAYSDATLLEGVLAAPFFWLHVSPLLIYNTLLLAGFAGSGIAMFVLARHLTGATGPSLVSAAVFTLAPYRIEHVMHLELQWAMWVPLTFWAIHRAVDDGSWRFGVLAGLSIWLQVLSCVYYGVFLAMTLVVFVPVLLALSGRRSFAALPGLVAGLAIAAVLTLPYAWPYMNAARTLGGRGLSEIARYSARPANYLSATSLNVVWGWTADRWGGRELRLFPGALAILLAIVSPMNRSWRWTMLYAAVGILAIELSFGTNGTVYRWLSEHVPALQGFRSASRFAIVASAGIAMLAGFGAQAIVERNRSRGTAIILVILSLMAIDYANHSMPMTPETLGTPSPVYRVIRSAGPGVVIEFPLPTPDQLPGWDPYYTSWSISHWNPLVNGYSGYYPPDYLQTLMSMRTFPDDASLARLHAHNVRYVIVHQAFYDPEQYTRLMLRIAVQPELRAFGSYKDPVGTAAVFVMER